MTGKNLYYSKDIGPITSTVPNSYEFWHIDSDPTDGDIYYDIPNSNTYSFSQISVSRNIPSNSNNIYLRLPQGFNWNGTNSNVLTLPRNSFSGILSFPWANVPACFTATPSSVSPGFFPSSARIGVDPTSNQDPLTNGLIVNCLATQSGNYQLPLRASAVDLGFADNYMQSPSNDFSVGTNSITFNNAGSYSISVNMPVISSGVKTIMMQVLKAGESLFTAPPATAAICTLTPLDTSVFPNLPGEFIFNAIGTLTGSGNIKINGGEEIALVFESSGVIGDTVVVELTSAISITKISP